MIPGEASTANSLLEKPLSQLTEDDIRQITREECRRFLKERGMRRPSWNKSQAIQQVISLKALLEDNANPGSLTATSRIQRKPHNPTSPALHGSPHSSLPSPTEPSGSGDSRGVRTEAKDPSPYRRKDPISLGFTVGAPPRILPAAFRPLLPSERLCPPPRTVSDDQTGQLTIFYGGEVNVYESIPSDKAQEIFQIAATPVQFDASKLTPPTQSYTGPTGRRPSVNPGTVPAGKLPRSFKDSLDQRRALWEPLPGKRADIGNGGSGSAVQAEKHH